MTESGQDLPKRPTRRRTTPKSSLISGEGVADGRPQKAVIEDVFDEVAAVRADLDAPAPRKRRRVSSVEPTRSTDEVSETISDAPKPRRRRAPEAAVEQAHSSFSDDDFGAGVDVDPAPGGRRPGRSSATPSEARPRSSQDGEPRSTRYATRTPAMMDDDDAAPASFNSLLARDASSSARDGSVSARDGATSSRSSTGSRDGQSSGRDGSRSRRDSGRGRRTEGQRSEVDHDRDGGLPIDQGDRINDEQASGDDFFRSTEGRSGEGRAGEGRPGEGRPGDSVGPDDGQGGQRRRRRRRRGRGGSGGEQLGGQQNGRHAQPRHSQFGQQRQGYGRDNRRGGGGVGSGQGQQGPRPHSGGSRDFVREPRAPRDSRDSRDHVSRDSGPRLLEVLAPCSGTLELHPKGYGFLRDPKQGYIAQESDAFVAANMIEKFKLREGVVVQGEMANGPRGQGPRLKTIDYIDGRTPEEYGNLKSFDELTAVNPFEQIKLETGSSPITMRVMDLLTPIGKGQRALIVAPPRSGKTMLLQEIADAVSINHPEVYLIVLLIDERPEEVTEMKRRIRGEVVASSMDRELESHIRVSQLVFERAKRMAEAGRDVFVLLDSITRTARAFNKWTSNTGRTMTGGLDVKAMDIPKKMFGTARRFEEGGSLTVVGTALVDTGSKMDDIIFQEFKGTGNMEMVLSRDLADRRIWPAIDITKSGTRREEKILPPEVMEGVIMLRRSLISMSPVEAMENLTRILVKYKTNAEFLAKVRSIL